MRTLFLLPMLLSACSEPAENNAAPASRTASIAGIYEGSGRLTMPNRICLTGEGTRFGLVMGSDGRSSCTARGRVDRSGSKLALVVDGDPACALTATLTDTKLDLDAARGKECSYYCGTGTHFQAASFYKAGGFYKAGRTQAEVREVVDLVGEPLC